MGLLNNKSLYKTDIDKIVNKFEENNIVNCKECGYDIIKSPIPRLNVIDTYMVASRLGKPKSIAPMCDGGIAIIYEKKNWLFRTKYYLYIEIKDRTANVHMQINDKTTIDEKNIKWAEIYYLILERTCFDRR